VFLLLPAELFQLFLVVVQLSTTLTSFTSFFGLGCSFSVQPLA
jgi:hypothetical protein